MVIKIIIVMTKTNVCKDYDYLWSLLIRVGWPLSCSASSWLALQYVGVTCAIDLMIVIMMRAIRAMMMLLMMMIMSIWSSWLAFQWVRVSWVIKVDHQVGHLLDARYGWKSVGQYLRQLTVDQLTDLYQCVQI